MTAVDQPSVAAGGRRWIENRPTKGLRMIDFGEMWAYRELAFSLAMRDIKVRYKQAIFGVMWAVIQPIAAALTFTLVFSRVANISTGDTPYLLFAFTGTLAWSFHSIAIGSGTESLVDNATLVTKIYYPKLVSPLASCLAPVVDLCVSLVILAIMLAVYGINPGLEILALPLALILLFVVAFAFSVWFAALNVRYRDVRYVVRFGIQIWLFLSPVAYPGGLISEDWEWVYSINPVVGVLEVLRWSTIGGDAPGRTTLFSIGIALTVLLTGLAYFQRTERRFADVV